MQKKPPGAAFDVAVFALRPRVQMSLGMCTVCSLQFAQKHLDYDHLQATPKFTVKGFMETK